MAARADQREVRGYAAPGPGFVAGARGGQELCKNEKRVKKDTNK